MSVKPSLRDLQATLHGVLRGEQPYQPLAKEWQVPPERLQIYAEFVAGHVRTVLDKNFPCLAHVLRDQWDGIATAYFREAAPNHYELNESGRAFPGFLAHNAARFALSPAHLELADLEWLDWDVYRDKAADIESLPLPIFDGETAFSAAIDGLSFVTNPTLVTVETLYDSHLAMADFAANHTCRLASTTSPCHVGVYRHPQSRQSTVRALDQIDLLALALAQQQLTLTTAPGATGMSLAQLAPLFNEAVVRGLVAAVALPK